GLDRLAGLRQPHVLELLIQREELNLRRGALYVEVHVDRAAVVRGVRVDAQAHGLEGGHHVRGQADGEGRRGGDDAGERGEGRPGTHESSHGATGGRRTTVAQLTRSRARLAPRPGVVSSERTPAATRRTRGPGFLPRAPRD